MARAEVRVERRARRKIDESILAMAQVNFDEGKNLLTSISSRTCGGSS